MRTIAFNHDELLLLSEMAQRGLSVKPQREHRRGIALLALLANELKASRQDDYLSDCGGSSDAAEVETAYRRGYQHGAYLALDALKHGVPFDAVHRWATQTLHTWRFKIHGKRLRGLPSERPPQPAVAARSGNAAKPSGGTR